MQEEKKDPVKIIEKKDKIKAYDYAAWDKYDAVSKIVQ